MTAGDAGGCRDAGAGVTSPTLGQFWGGQQGMAVLEGPGAGLQHIGWEGP